MAKEYFFVFYSVLAVILLTGVRPAAKGLWREESLSLKSSKGILGFCAVGIMLHHMSQTIYFANEDPGVLLFMVDIGVCFVGMFFFFSGYGLYSSLRDKPGYLQGFMRSRMPTILVPFYMCNFVFILGSCLWGYKLQDGELPRYLTGVVLMNSQMWYIVEILILYLMFYLVFRFVGNRNVACLVYGICLILLIAFSLWLGHDTTTPTQGLWFHGEWWYNTTLLMLAGILFAKWQQQILGFVRKFYGIVLVISVLLVAFFYNRTMHMLHTTGYWYEWEGYPGYKEKWQTLAFQTPFVIFVVFTVIVVLQKIEIGNKALDFLGSIALELYLIHNLFLLYMPVRNRVGYIVACYAASILVAILLHLIDQKLIGLIRQIGRKEKV